MAGLLSFIFLGEVMAPPQILGGGLVIGSIVLLQVKQEHDSMAPAILRAQRTANGR
jgi:drug/metabolite transporter (DMT)-like permease